MDEEQQKAIPKEHYDRIIANYNAVLPRFASGVTKRDLGTNGVGYPYTNALMKPSSNGK
jgi:hypothetical protein